jgi:hypothetical protein
MVSSYCLPGESRDFIERDFGAGLVILDNNGTLENAHVMAAHEPEKAAVPLRSRSYSYGWIADTWFKLLSRRSLVCRSQRPEAASVHASIPSRSAESGPMAPKARPKGGTRGEKIWRWPLWVFYPCNHLKFHTIAKAFGIIPVTHFKGIIQKAFFGNPWRKTAQFWKSLPKP